MSPRLHYIGAWAPIHWSPFISKTCFLFYFRTCITLNQRFPVHLIDPHVTHKTWFYHNFFFSFLPRILKIKFWGSNILEPGSNILEPPNDYFKLITVTNFWWKSENMPKRYIMPESVLDSSLPENHCYCPFALQVKSREMLIINIQTWHLKHIIDQNNDATCSVWKSRQMKTIRGISQNVKIFVPKEL